MGNKYPLGVHGTFDFYKNNYLLYIYKTFAFRNHVSVSINCVDHESRLLNTIWSGA